MKKFPHGPHDGPRTSTHQIERERDEAITRRRRERLEAEAEAAKGPVGQAHLRALLDKKIERVNPDRPKREALRQQL